MSDEKYPPNIQKLFDSGLSIPHLSPIDYPVEHRKTSPIAPVSQYKSILDEYVKEFPSPKTPKSTDLALTAQVLKAQAKKAQTDSFNRQLDDWNNPELLLKHDQEMKDPYKTVFIGRLDYKVTEIDISTHFSRFGPISSIKIVRDSNKSRGYGFLVFERDGDAKTCIRECGPTGMAMPGFRGTVLVDMERGRLVRNWKPRRLGGGLGGRGWGTRGPASAAASGRRMNLLMNPWPGQPGQPGHASGQGRATGPYSSAGPGQAFSSRPPGQAYSSAGPAYSGQPGLTTGQGQGQAQAYSSVPQAAYSSRSIKDKYSGYRSSSSIRRT